MWSLTFHPFQAVSFMLLSYNLCNTVIVKVMNDHKSNRERKKKGRKCLMLAPGNGWLIPPTPHCLVFKIPVTIKFTQLKRMKINFQFTSLSDRLPSSLGNCLFVFMFSVNTRINFNCP